MYRKLLMGSLLCSLSSCVLHPPYQRPNIELPEAWRVSSSEGEVIANVNWWTQFQDPVLNGLVMEALENNHDLQVAIARVSEFWSQYKVVRSQVLPQLFGTASEVKQEQSLAFGGPPPTLKRTYNTYNLAINLSWEIDLWGRFISESEAAFASYLGSIETKRSVILSLVSSVADSYILLHQFDMQLEIAKKTQASREKSLKLAQDRYQGGLTSEMEVKQAESEVDNAKVQVNQLEIQQQQEENLLCVLVGRPPGVIHRDSSVSGWKLPPTVPAGLPSQLLEQRPDILQAEQKLKAANALKGAALAQAFPSISLTGLYGGSSIELKDLLKESMRTWQLGSSLLQSLYSGGRITAQIKEADAQFEQALHQYEQTILNGLQEVDDALIAHQKTKELAAVQRHQVDVLRQYLQLATLQYDNGQTDYLNVLDAERTLFAAQLNLAQSEANCFLTLIDVYKSLGGGWILEAERTLY